MAEESHKTKQLLKENDLLRAKIAGLEESKANRKQDETIWLKRDNYLSALNQAKEILLNSKSENIFQQFIDILGAASNASRTYIFIKHTNEKGEVLVSQKAEYCSEGINPEIDNPDLQNVKYDDYAPGWEKLLLEGKTINGNVKDFPEREKAALEAQGINTILIIPIITNDEFIGFIGFDNCKDEREWDKSEQNFLIAAARDLAQFIEKNKSQEQLAAELKRFQTTMDSIDAVVYVADMESYELLFSNKTFNKLIGEKIGEKCYSVIQKGQASPCDYCTNHLLLDKKGNPKEPHVWEFQNTNTKKWYQCRDQAIPWSNGKIVRLEIATDITTRKQAELTLQNSESKLRQIIDQVPHCIFVKDETGKFEIVNKAAAELFGMTVEDLTGRSDSEFVPDEKEMKHFRSVDLEVIRSGKTKFMPEDTLTDSKNNVKYFQTTKVPFNFSASKRPSLLGVSVDITERKIAEKEINAKQTFNELLLDSMPYPIMLINKNRIVKAANKIAFDHGVIIGDYCWKGFGRSECLSEKDKIRAKKYPDEPGIQCTFCMMDEIFQTNKQCNDPAVEAFGKIWDTFWIPLSNDEFLHYAIDITERKNNEILLQNSKDELQNLNSKLEVLVEEEVAKSREKDHVMLLQSKQAAMGEMIGNIAHQWRQPLNDIGLFIQNIQDSYEYNELSSESLNTIVEKTMKKLEYMSQTIDDFRNFFSTDKEKTKFSVTNSVRKTLVLTEASIKNNYIEVTLSLQENLKVTGYPNEFSQVCLNILNNAKDVLIERKTKNPKIKIDLSKKADKIVLSILDNAGGIKEDIIDKVFEPYFTTRDKQAGTGLGLYISKTIIERNMAGKLSVRNTKNGAEFRIELDI